MSELSKPMQDGIGYNAIKGIVFSKTRNHNKSAVINSNSYNDFKKKVFERASEKNRNVHERME